MSGGQQGADTPFRAADEPLGPFPKEFVALLEHLGGDEWESFDFVNLIYHILNCIISLMLMFKVNV